MSSPERLLEMALDRARKKWSTSKNVAKGDWYEMTDEQVRSRIRDEIEELWQALSPCIHGDDCPRCDVDWDAIVDEAVDVFAFALMGADPRRGTK